MAERIGSIKVTGPSKTQQEFRDECNIKTIVRKAMMTGQGLPKPTTKGFFGEFIGIDFQDMQNTLTKAQQAFMTLPAAIRRRFNNNPGQLIDFIEDNQNYEEAVKLGLIPLPPKKEAEKPPVPVPPLDVTGTSDTK